VASLGPAIVAGPRCAEVRVSEEPRIIAAAKKPPRAKKQGAQQAATASGKETTSKQPLTPDPSPARGEGSVGTASEAVKPGLAAKAEREETEPATTVSEAAADRPSWAGAEPFKDGAVYKWPVTLDPRATKSEAEEELLPAAANAVIAEYARKKLKLDITPYQQSSGGWPYLPEEYVRGQMIGGDVWAEPVNVSFGRWIRLHALLKFDRQTNERLRERWKDGETVRRLANVGVLGTCLLLALATAWAYLKADLATAGRYRWRLRLAATSLIAALMILGMSVT
jgi:hypothetical protein